MLTLQMLGGLCMFLFGMKTMSDGLQKSTGDKMRKALNFMTSNRFIGVFTGFLVTAIIQSSTAFSVIVVSFVNAGLMNLTQSIGVILGTNIGTTLTAWIISIVGFKLSIDSLALPAIGIGFIISITKWKYRSIGEFLLGFGFLFLGLFYLTSGMANVNDIFDFSAIGNFGGGKIFAILIGAGVGFIMTLIINSSTASVALIMALAFQDIIVFEMAAGMILGSNLGTPLNAVIASLAGNINAKQTALVHVLFNVIGIVWALPMLIPMLKLVQIILPGDPWAAIASNEAIPLHLAGLHTTYNIINTLLFLPFVKQFANLITFLLPEKQIALEKEKDEIEHYKFSYLSAIDADSPELNILRAEKEISNMAGLVSLMFARFCAVLRILHEDTAKEKTEELCIELQRKEEFIDEMREELTNFLIECSKIKLCSASENRISYLMQVVVSLESMSDECYSISRLLEKSVSKSYLFKDTQLDDLIPYVGLVEEFLVVLEKQLSPNTPAKDKAPVNFRAFSSKQAGSLWVRASELEKEIDKSRKKLQKLGRQRLEAGENVRTELLFIDIVRRIEKLGDYCYEITGPNKKLPILGNVFNFNFGKKA